ncbi:unnamed protein product [Triticum turgidum subsp. durum]|uniref:Tf2-1-like SH3-like domain-containing protein n=1 Tax=Triticum turgidum subsp. durum TaxID=4567 RepID=A0A9R1A598_TRITD|nr:unnamed protein product [Triticum turgidum subsp. durum]
METMLRQHLLRARQHMKESADKRRSDRVFQVDDRVFLKLQPYLQRSVATRANTKLSFKYFGPFQVIQKVGNVAYKLKLPETSTVHPVFHVSQLRSALPPSENALEELPHEAAPQPEPVEVLDSRIHHRAGVDVPQVLVRWTDQPAALATWEDREELRLYFPAATAWGQAASQGRGNVMAPPTSSATPGAATSTTKAQTEIEAHGRPTRARKGSERYPAHSWVTG